MSIQSVSSYSTFQTTINNALKVETNLTNLQEQLSSGDKSSDFEGISSQAAQYLQLDSQLSRTQSYLDNNNILQTRVDTSSTILGQVSDTINSIETLISQRRTGTDGVKASFNADLTQQWQELVGQLNTSVGGFYLFGGSQTAQPPVDSTNLPTLNADGTVNTDYYKGSDQDLTSRADDSVELTYNVRADNPAFQNLFAGIASAIKADQDNSDTEFQTAYNLVQQASNGVISAKATVDSNTVTLNDINTNLTSLQTYWKGVKDNIGNTDLVTASTLVASDQGVLQAAFSAFAKINSLRLSNYLTN